jgi:hypothetical protein
VRADEKLTAFAEPESAIWQRVNYWEIIAENLKKRDWSLRWVSALDREGRTIWIADAHRDGKRYFVRADEKLTAFLGLERAICVGLLTEHR